MESAKGKTREEIITRLADRIDGYEKYSEPHSRVMAELAALLARRLGLLQPDITAIAEAALLHDIGLYAMNPPYHSQSDLLSFEQRMDLWRHPIVGEQQMGKREASRHAQLLVRWHHEWWDGSGYPDMLAFEDIPIGARILRAVELFSALSSDRPYRAALSADQVIETLKASAGVECDPYIISALLALIEDFRTHAALTPHSSAPFSTQLYSAPGGGQPASPQSPEPFLAAETFSGPLSSPDLQPLSGTDDIGRAGSRSRSLVEMIGSRSAVESLARDEAGQWRGWRGSRYNNKSMLGFEASVLRQIEFRSIAIPLCGWARLEWYLKAWGKLIFSNDPRAWAAAVSRATIEARGSLAEESIARLLEDVYVPGTKLSNPQLRRWFGETDAWWMDNLRRNIEAIEDETLRAQALMLGLQTGDYGLSFDDETRDLKRPLTTIFWRLAGRAAGGPAGHPHNRSYKQPIDEFIMQARADLLYLRLPSAHTDLAGAEARSDWRESWVRAEAGPDDDGLKLISAPQSKYAYLGMVDRLLRASLHIKLWTISYQETGLASAHDISELIKDHRPVRATYSKDLTEVAGGLRSYIILAERA